MANSKLLGLLLVFCIAAVQKANGVKCYECNVFKAGYGQKCDQPRIRDDCIYCMKVSTTVFMGYYKNTPRKSTIISRVCAKSHTVHFSSECFDYQTADGYSTRCYCYDDLCNGSRTVYNISILTLIPILMALNRLWKLL